MALREGESLPPPPARRSVDEGEPAALSEPRGTARAPPSPPDRAPLGPPCSRSDGRTGTVTLSEPLEAEGEKTEGLEPLRPPSDEPLLLPELELLPALDPLEDEGELELEPRSTAEPVPLPRSPESELPRCAQTDAGLSASAVTHIVASNLPRFMDHAPEWRKATSLPSGDGGFVRELSHCTRIPPSNCHAGATGLSSKPGAPAGATLRVVL
jgi:hypothetical protein